MRYLGEHGTGGQKGRGRGLQPIPRTSALGPRSLKRAYLDLERCGLRVSGSTPLAKILPASPSRIAVSRTLWLPRELRGVRFRCASKTILAPCRRQAGTPAGPRGDSFAWTRRRFACRAMRMVRYTSYSFPSTGTFRGSGGVQQLCGNPNPIQVDVGEPLATWHDAQTCLCSYRRAVSGSRC
jgi:hypothetical protein